MTHLEFFINRVNVNDVPELNKEQFLYILKIISLEGEINVSLIPIQYIINNNTIVRTTTLHY